MDSNAPTRLANESPAKISRALVALLNTYEEKPDRVNIEYLPEDAGMTIATRQTPYIVRQYITGGYVAAYSFDLIYKTFPANNEQRLEADETLDAMVTWLIQNIHSLDCPGITVKRLDRQSLAILIARYDNGAEDHASTLNLTYEVI